MVVCIGNMCRSQMAEGLARHMGGDRVQVQSAGTHPTGEVSPEAIDAMAEIGIDIGTQWSKGLGEVDLASADVIISMSHVPAGEMVPAGFGGRIEDWEVADPIGYPIEIFRFVRHDLHVRLESLFARCGVPSQPLPALPGGLREPGPRSPA